jgi:hypothetical protein
MNHIFEWTSSTQITFLSGQNVGLDTTCIDDAASGTSKIRQKANKFHTQNVLLRIHD